MGEQRRRKERFLREHPYCCFCGGHTLATTEDHQPGRVFFRNREWPEGFVFPACVPCNAASRNSERILGVLIHGHADDDDRSVYQKNLESVRREFPEQIQNLIMTTREARNVFKDRGLKTPRGFTFSEIPLVKIHHEFWDPHFTIFSRKLLLALHYQCFAAPLSPKGAIWHYIHTNLDLNTGKFPKEILEMAEHVARPVRHKRMLHDQFAIRWNFIKESKTAIFTAQLHRKLIISGITTEEPERFSSAWDREAMGPFQHKSINGS